MRTVERTGGRVVLMGVYDGPGGDGPDTFDPDSYTPAAAAAERFRHTLGEQMRAVRDLIALGLTVRGVKVRQPLASATVFTRNPYLYADPEWAKHLLDEWNVGRLVVRDIRCFTDARDRPDVVEFDRDLTPELVAEGEARQRERERIRAAVAAERAAKRQGIPAEG